MKKLLLLVALMGVVACSKTTAAPVDGGCTEASCSIHADGGTTDINDVIIEDNWQFTLPGSGWAAVESSYETIKVIFVNQELGSVIFFLKEPTTDTYPDYIIGALRTFKSGGLTVASAKQVSIGGKNFLAITATGKDRTIWTWITVQKGFGYAFSCAADGTTLGDAATNLLYPYNLCSSIANTVEIQ
jgi:hypothetical protein